MVVASAEVVGGPRGGGGQTGSHVRHTRRVTDIGWTAARDNCRCLTSQGPTSHATQMAPGKNG